MSKIFKFNGLRLVFVGVVGVCLVLMVGQSAMAHGNATGVVKQRMDLMSSIGKKMKSIAAMVKGKAPFNPESIGLDAAGIGQVSPEIKTLFPAGSLHKPSEALPVIWDDWERFTSLTVRLETEANNLQAAALQGDKKAVTRQFVSLGKVCSSCHTDFRKKKE
ncbi:c-type cytochrome [Sedimenticola sp.]|uniref:c-type cytochrome n=1 Tax=Sedimenticola sp. TaxID=1940285 RepID=UPI003D0F85B1